jgi:hypothetical protein
MRTGNRDNKGTIKVNTPLCCDITPEAIAGGFQVLGGRYSIDSDRSGETIYCRRGRKANPPPENILQGVAKWAKDQQLDFGSCAYSTWLPDPAVPARLITPGSTNSDNYCTQEEVVCGGKNAPGKNDSWNGFYCCYVQPGPVHYECLMDAITDAPFCSILPGAGSDQCLSNEVGGPCPCVFDASPRTLVIPPLATSSIVWSCPYGCTKGVSIVEDDGDVLIDNIGGPFGEIIVYPSSTTSYELHCGMAIDATTGSSTLDDTTLNNSTTVRVFDTTRIETKP